MNDIANRIKDLMSDRDLSYMQLSNMTGISKSALQRYVSGETGKIPLARLELIAKALNVPAAFLLGWIDEKAPDSKNGIGQISSIDVEIVNLIRSLSAEDQEKAVSYLRYLSESEHK